MHFCQSNLFVLLVSFLVLSGLYIGQTVFIGKILKYCGRRTPQLISTKTTISSSSDETTS